MGSGESKPKVTPFASEESLNDPICDPCVNQHKPAKGWCGQCSVYLCNNCVSTHTRSHRVATGKQLPKQRPQYESLTNNVLVKQALPVATLEDKDIKIESVPGFERNIYGCISVDDYIVTIREKNLTLYNEDFECIGDIDYKVLHPSSICSRGYDIVVSFRRITQEELGDPTKKWPKFNDIQTYKLEPPGCASVAKLTKGVAFNTDGECFSTAVCPLYDKNLTIAAGMRLDSHPEREDIEFQVQIIKSNGKVLKTLNINQLGEPCFTCEFFLCATMKFEEIVVSEAKLRRVRGLNMKTGKTLFEFEGGSPQGLAYDKDDNVYVYNDSAIYWIAPLRHKIHYMQQGYNKTFTRRESRLANAICYNDNQKLLYLTCVDKSTIETYRIV